MLLVVVGVVLPITRSDSAEPPNIILLMADDLGWGDPGYNGNRIIKTPHLDQMSREGLRFDRFYAASAVCSPTRGACLTGRNSTRFGIVGANQGHLNSSEICLAERLRERGYQTGHFGKWHLGTLTPDYSGKGDKRRPKQNYSTPGMNGFDQWFSTEFAVATWDPYDPANKHTGSGTPFDPRALYWHNGRNITEPLAGDDSRIIMDRVVPFVDQAAETKQPFFAVVWFHAPHLPVVGGPEYRALYSTHDEHAQHYYACITALDEQIGRLRKRLQDLNVDQNTMLWFCSDNGPEGNPGPTKRSQGSAGPYRGRKRSLYEGGTRVPGILVWPDIIKQPRVTDFPAVTSDYFPTVLEILGERLPPQRPYDGISLLPVIEGRLDKRPQPIGFQVRNQAALSDNRYKLVYNKGIKRHKSDNGKVKFAEWELYDLQNDPSETRNIAADRPEILLRMKNKMTTWQASCEASASGADYNETK